MQFWQTHRKNFKKEAKKFQLSSWKWWIWMYLSEKRCSIKCFLDTWNQILTPSQRKLGQMTITSLHLRISTKIVFFSNRDKYQKEFVWTHRKQCWQRAKEIVCGKRPKVFAQYHEKNAYHLFQLQKDFPKIQKVFIFEKLINVMKLSSWKKRCHLPKVILKKWKAEIFPMVAGCPVILILAFVDCSFFYSYQKVFFLMIFSCCIYKNFAGPWDFLFFYQFFFPSSHQLIHLLTQHIFPRMQLKSLPSIVKYKQKPKRSLAKSFVTVRQQTANGRSWSLRHP